MQAIVWKSYNLPKKALILEAVEKPSPKKDEILVKIQAASINSWDWDLVRGEPKILRIFTGIFKPSSPKVVGCDFAGIVESKGTEVNSINLGDVVFGDSSGCGFSAFAEYICVKESVVAAKSINSKLKFENLAAIPQAGVLALQGLSKGGPISQGDKILINGGGGGVGTFAIQICKSFGAEVTGVDSGDKLAIMSAVGADHVIDYKAQDFTTNGLVYDRILDMVAKRSRNEIKRSLVPRGSYVAIGGSLITLALVAITNKLSASKQRMTVLAHKPNVEDMLTLQKMIDGGKISPVIDQVYKLNEAADAIQYLGDGLVKGKVILSINSNP